MFGYGIGVLLLVAGLLVLGVRDRAEGAEGADLTNLGWTLTGVGVIWILLTLVQELRERRR
ncbi:MAG TPA: DUF6458 family protein [Nocardioides sp.]|nr:DUF6458 family protein [Nocardioides sp.]